jgi:hypothetical protein
VVGTSQKGKVQPRIGDVSVANKKLEKELELFKIKEKKNEKVNLSIQRYVFHQPRENKSR